MKSLAKFSRAALGAVLAIGAVLAMTACALPDKPTRSTVFDFGPGPLTVQAQNRMAPLPPITLSEVDAVGGFDTSTVMYRLGYANSQQLRPYAQARWSMTPPQLILQRMRDSLGATRPIFNVGEGPAQTRVNGQLPNVLRVELIEFTHYFSSPTESVGLVRMRVTLVDAQPGGEKLLGQRVVIAQKPAPTADAAGGVKALSAATDAAIEEINQWLNQI